MASINIARTRMPAFPSLFGAHVGQRAQHDSKFHFAHVQLQEGDCQFTSQLACVRQRQCEAPLCLISVVTLSHHDCDSGDRACSPDVISAATAVMAETDGIAAPPKASLPPHPRHYDSASKHAMSRLCRTRKNKGQPDKMHERKVERERRPDILMPETRTRLNTSRDREALMHQERA